MNASQEKLSTRLAVIVAVASFAVIPMAIYGLGPEWARWDASQANYYFRQGKVKDALYQLQEAVRKSPRDPVVKLTLAERLIEIDRPEEGLELAEKVLDSYPGNADATHIKANAQQHMGDFSAALETKLEFDRGLEAYRRDARNFNDIAYFRALANRELHLAKRDIEEAVATSNRYISWKGDHSLQPPERTVVLASLIAMQCGRETGAIIAISEQLRPLVDEIELRRNRLSRIIHDDLQSSFPIRQSGRAASLREDIRDMEGRAAVMLTCRALILQSTGNLIDCRLDRLRVADYGFDSATIASDLPEEDKLALQMLRQIVGFLDTRGFVRSLLPWIDGGESLNDASADYVSSYPAALRDLKAAVFGSEMELASFDSNIRNSVEFTEDKVRAKKEAKRQAAILNYHLMLAFDRAGEADSANIAEERVRELGFEPGPNLF